MTKSKFLFTAILATMISAGAWANAPGDTNDDGSIKVAAGAHDVYVDVEPTDGEAGAGIAGVTYVNRVANRAGAAAQAAENHAAHASASASAAQTSADSAADAASAASDAAADAASAAEVAKNITAGDGIVVTDETDDNDNVIGKKIAVKPGKGIEIAADGTVAVTPGGGIMIRDDTVSVSTGNGLRYDNDVVAVNPGDGLKFDEQGALTTNLVAGDNVTLNEDEDGAVTISATAGDTILDATADHTLSNINAGEGIEIEQNGSNNEITDITVEIKSATETELGGVFAPASLADAQKSLEEIGSRGKDIFDPDNQALIAITYPLAVELAAQGQLSGAYREIGDAPALIPSNYEELKSRPLSAYAYLESATAGNETQDATQRGISDASYVNMPTDMKSKDEPHAVGDAARPVYVADAETADGKHSGVVTPIESVAIPVGDDDFTGATSTAKIWIQ